jgi:hypothetical protein
VLRARDARALPRRRRAARDHAAADELKSALISRLKILASLNIAERRVPQDGRIKLKMGKKVVDFRVSTLPTLFGEKVVLRILDKGNLALDLETFGIEPRPERELSRRSPTRTDGARHRPHRARARPPRSTRRSPDQHRRREHHDRRGPRRVQPLGINQVQVRPRSG